MTGYLRLARPGQWVKNLFVLAGAFFGGKFTEPSCLATVLVGFVAFCALSSGVYALNDALDAQADALHPEKKNRPIPSGQLSKKGALAFSTVLLALGLGISGGLSLGFAGVAFSYLLLNIAYSLGLKRLVILDALMVAGGFLLRALAGAVLVGVAFSHWLLLSTLFIALLIALAKRKHEINLMGDQARSHRRSLAGYTPKALDQLISVAGGLTLLTYALYTVSPDTITRLGNDWAVWTTPIVVYGVMRFMFLVQAKNLSPDKVILRDPGLLSSIAIWAAAMFVVIYLV